MKMWVPAETEEEELANLKKLPLYKKQELTYQLAVMRVPTGILYLFEDGPDRIAMEMVKI